MSGAIPSSTLEKFSTFGDLLRFLRRRAGITQVELSIAVGYSDSQISRLEQNLRLPDIPTIQARFVSALGLEDEPVAVSKMLELAANVRREDAPGLGICPYKGLNFFDETDADLFVGRETLTNRLVERVLALTAKSETGSERFLAIVGASGSGKSSLVRAGLVPALRWHPASANWPIYTLTPTAHPLESLATSLMGPVSSPAATATLIDDLAREPRSLGLVLKRALKSEYAAHHLLVVVDQFEELFALCRSEEERTAFLDNLLTAACETDGPMLAVITLRADFYAHCAGYPRLRQALAGQQEYIGAMSAEELRRAIQEPARRGRWEIEAGLVDLLLHEVGADAGHPAEPGALPLLSHALLETWQRRRGRTLTLSGYTSSGGVRGAIAETAEAVVADRFTQEQKAIARRIFLRLTELGDETAAGDTRRRATFSELILKPEEAGATQAVLKALADARLIITHEDSAEVAHEALIREWPKLRGWLEDNREGLRLHRHLTEAAQEWLAADREPDGLYRGARLAQASEWAAAHAEEMNPLERDFLEASLNFAEREAAEREAQRQRELEAAQKLAEAEKQRAGEQARAAGQLRKRAWYLAGAFLIALGMAFTALFFSAQARRAATTAQEHERVAFVRELAAAALSNLEVDPERSILLALEAVSVASAVDNAPMVEAENALRRALLASRVELTLRGHEGQVWAAAYSPDGTRLATASEDGTARIWDAASGQELLSLTMGYTVEPHGIAFSPDGSRLATPGAGGNAIVWDAISGEQLLTLRGLHSVVNGIAYGPDGKLLATAGDDGTAKIWDAATGQELQRLRGKSGRLRSVALSPDGTRLAAGEDDGTVILWDVVTGEELFTLSVFDQEVVGASFSPDGARLATTAGHGTIKIWDVATGEELLTLRGHTGWIESVAFSPDGSRLATASDDGTAKVWDSLTGQELFTLSGHAGAVISAVFSPDCATSAPDGLVEPCGARLATASRNGTARVWNASFSRELLTFNIDNDISRAFSPDSTRLATGSTDGILKLWDISTALDPGLTGASSAPTELWSSSAHAGAVNQITFSPDGTRLATTSLFDNTAKVWDTATGKELLTFAHTSGVFGLVFSPDGARLATASTDYKIRVWDLAGTRDRAPHTLFVSPARYGDVFFIAFSLDGARLAAGNVDNYAKVWDAETGKELLTLRGHDGIVWRIAFSPDGTRMATTSQDMTARLWDADSGQELLTFQGHTARTLPLAFSPDGRRLATGGQDGTVRVWDTSTGQELLTLYGHPDEVWDLDWSADGSRLFTGSDGTIRIYLLQLDDLVALARTRVTRQLTTQECQDYLHLSEEHCQQGTEMK